MAHILIIIMIKNDQLLMFCHEQHRLDILVAYFLQDNMAHKLITMIINNDHRNRFSHEKQI